MESQPEWAVTLWGLLLLIVGLALLVGLLMWIYRTLQRPRLYVSYREGTQEPYFAWQSVVRYLLLTPIALGVWYYAILIIIGAAAADNREPEQIALAAAVVVGAVRLLAHISTEASHELGKTIPLTAVTLILVGGTASGEGLERLSGALDVHADNLDWLYSVLLVLDFVVTALWAWRQHSRWVAHQPGTNRNRILLRLKAMNAKWKHVRDFGKPAQPYTGPE